MPRSRSISLVLLLALTGLVRADERPDAALAPVSPERRAWAEDLARSLSLELRAIHAVKQPPWLGKDGQVSRPGWSGLSLELDGLTIECRRCEDPSEADALFGEHVTPVADARTVVELRGESLVVLRGRVLDDPRVAVRALDLAWPRSRAETPRAIATLAPNDPAGMGPFAGYSFQPAGSLYQAGAGVLGACRRNDAKHAERAAAGISWRYLDDGVRNHVLAALPGDLVVEALVTPSTMLYSQGTGEAQQRREEDYLMALLGAAQVTPPPPSKSLVELLDAHSGR